MQNSNLLQASSEVVTCSHIKDDAQTSTLYHRHDNYVIYLLLNGKVNFYLDHHGYQMEKGSLLFMRPHVFHRLEYVNPENCERIKIHIKNGYFRTLSSPQTDLSDVISRRGNGSLVSFHLSRHQINEILKKSLALEKSLHWERFGDDILSECLLKEILLLLNRIPQNNDVVQQPDLFMPTIVTELVSYIDKNLTADLSIKALAATFKRNGQYLSHRFRQSMGVPLQQYIIHKRIDLAQNFLKKGYPLTKACYASGFHDYSNFSKIFTKYVGISPKQYQLQSVSLW